jgi:hypothetical protein
MATLLDIVRKVTPRLGLKRPALVVGATDLTSQMLLEFANQEGDELSRYHDWQALIVEKSYTSIAQVEQTNALVSTDYDRLAYNVEIWNRSTNQRYSGPTPQRVRQQLQSGVTGGIAGWWWVMGNELNIYPAPPAGQTLAFEYISKNWCEKADGTPQSEWLADTDIPRVPARLIELGLIWRFQQSRGLATYAESLSTYEREKERAASRDRGTGRIRPSNTNNNDLPPYPFWSGSVEN